MMHGLANFKNKNDMTHPQCIYSIHFIAENTQKTMMYLKAASVNLTYNTELVMPVFFFYACTIISFVYMASHIQCPNIFHFE